tara:strand:+ start:128 stop:370 length:243 start_codon:yes stop_codon:yes gene_type:complete
MKELNENVITLIEWLQDEAANPVFDKYEFDKEDYDTGDEDVDNPIVRYKEVSYLIRQSRYDTLKELAHIIQGVLQIDIKN